MKATTSKLASTLRRMADWLEAHDIDGDALVAASVDGWGDCSVHLSNVDFTDLVPTCEFINGHGVGLVDGMKVVTVLPRRERPGAVEGLEVRG